MRITFIEQSENIESGYNNIRINSCSAKAMIHCELPNSDKGKDTEGTSIKIGEYSIQQCEWVYFTSEGECTIEYELF